MQLEPRNLLLTKLEGITFFEHLQGMGIGTYLHILDVLNTFNAHFDILNK